MGTGSILKNCRQGDALGATYVAAHASRLLLIRTSRMLVETETLVLCGADGNRSFGDHSALAQLCFFLLFTVVEVEPVRTVVAFDKGI